MRINCFSHASMQAFWSVPVQALAPWFNRIRHSLETGASSPTARRLAEAAQPALRPRIATASNDLLFHPPGEMVHRTSKANQQHPLRSTLRIVRESDVGIRPDCAGRMVISGRMADVCAELDRMALQATGGEV